MSAEAPASAEFVPSLCLVRPAVASATELLEALAAVALDAGYVRPSFAEALLQRERDHPTGLPTATPVAIPHVDAAHVLRPALAAATLDAPVTFREMGSADRTVEVALVVVLLVTDPGAQVATLGRLIAMFQQPDLGAAVDALTTPEDLARTLSDRWSQC